jgi:PAS domain S-box-containing protein
MPALIAIMVIIALAVGAVGFRYLEGRLVASTGETLALAASAIADKLDILLAERAGDIQIMSQAGVFRERNVAAMTAHLHALREAYPVYAWLGVADAQGRLIAATDPANVGRDRSGLDWFRAVRDRGGIHVRDAQVSEDSGGVMAVAFTAPIRSPGGAFLGAITARMALPVLEDVFAQTTNALQAQYGAGTRIEHQFLRRDGTLIADSHLRQEEQVNLKQLGLPSALLTDSAQAGYIEEMHLRRQVPVVTGYAKAEQGGNYYGLHWGVLVRMDRDDILAPANKVRNYLLLVSGLAGAPMFGLLLWATNRLRKEWAAAQAEAAHATAAEEQAHRLSYLLEESLNEIYVFDAETLKFLMVNKGARMNLGYTMDELRALTPLDLNPAYSPESFAALVQPLRAGGQQMVRFTTIHRRKDGSTYPVEAHLQLFSRAASPVFIAIILDITERTRLEEQLRQSQKMEAVGQLAGGIAHDFNNMLTVINGYSQLLLSRAGPGFPYRAEIEEIDTAGARAATLTRQLLAFSRKQVLAPQVLMLNAVVTNLEPMLRRLIGEDIELRAVLQPQPGYVLADPGQIEQVIMNLAVNARDAMPRGGILTIETVHVEMDESYTQRSRTVRAGPHVMMAVSDTGCGMDKETQARIFEPFFTTKEQGKGTGLGLATVYGIVKQSGGSIWVYSEPGHGTTFKIYLPRIEGTGEAVAPVEARDERVNGSETILVAEDDEGVRKLTVEVLRAAGYTVLEAATGPETIALGERHQGDISLLVTDVVMPGMNGRVLAEQLSARLPGMKVLYLSGYTDDTIVSHGVLDDSVSFLQKPFSPPALARKVRAVLDA